MEKEKKEITVRVKDNSLSEEELQAVSGGESSYVRYLYVCLDCNWSSGSDADKSVVDAKRDQHAEQYGHYDFDFHKYYVPWNEWEQR